MRAAKNDLRLRGITVSPANQDFHPADTRAMDVYAEAEGLEMPILIHPSGQFTEQSKLEFGRPYLFDEVARGFPNLRMVIAQLGQPWVDETICMLAKHPQVYADVSGLLSRPWQAYNALVSVYQHGVIDKLLFGSDFPYTSATECIETLYSINQLAQGTNLPLVPREALRGIVQCERVHGLNFCSTDARFFHLPQFPGEFWLCNCRPEPPPAHQNSTVIGRINEAASQFLQISCGPGWPCPYL